MGNQPRSLSEADLDLLRQCILKSLSGDYVGEGGTFNSSRAFAKRFASEDEARAYAKANRMHAEFTVEAA